MGTRGAISIVSFHVRSDRVVDALEVGIELGGGDRAVSVLVDRGKPGVVGGFGEAEVSTGS